MTNEKLNELKEALANAGRCDIVNICINDNLITDIVPIGEDSCEIVGYDVGTCIKLRISEIFRRYESIWIQDHKDLSYEFKCNLTDKHVNIVTYCNGEITTINR